MRARNLVSMSRMPHSGKRPPSARCFNSWPKCRSEHASQRSRSCQSASLLSSVTWGATFAVAKCALSVRDAVPFTALLKTFPMQEQVQTESELLHIRREKLEAMRAKGIEPFGGRFDTTHQPGVLRKEFAPDVPARIAGRMTARRTMGKAVFFDLSDITGRIQCYVNKKEIGDDTFALLTEMLDIGDWVGVTGKTFVTKTGEP